VPAVDGAYEAGQGRNTGEARAVVEEAATLIAQTNDRSIGIVAVNKAQSELIESMNGRACRVRPRDTGLSQAWEDTLESSSSRTLKTFRADERDFILISTVLWKDRRRSVPSGILADQQRYGHRRLNVLFTRAKRRLALFTSLDHSQIVADGKQRGVRVLRSS